METQFFYEKETQNMIILNKMNLFEKQSLEETFCKKNVFLKIIQNSQKNTRTHSDDCFCLFHYNQSLPRNRHYRFGFFGSIQTARVVSTVKTGSTGTSSRLHSSFVSTINIQNSKYRFSRNNIYFSSKSN